MRTISKITTVILVMFASTQAMAAFSLDELHVATATGISELTKTAPEHIPHVNAYKTWISGEDAKVKLYVAHDGMNMEFNYLCHKHPGKIECHAQ